MTCGPQSADVLDIYTLTGLGQAKKKNHREPSGIDHFG